MKRFASNFFQSYDFQKIDQIGTLFTIARRHFLARKTLLSDGTCSKETPFLMFRFWKEFPFLPIFYIYH